MDIGRNEKVVLTGLVYATPCLLAMGGSWNAHWHWAIGRDIVRHHAAVLAITTTADLPVACKGIDLSAIGNAGAPLSLPEAAHECRALT